MERGRDTFAPPPVIDTKVYADINAQHGITDHPSEWAGLLFGRPDTQSFLEGPAFDLDGNLWLVDLARGRLFRISPDGEWWSRPNMRASPMGWSSTRTATG